MKTYLRGAKVDTGDTEQTRGASTTPRRVFWLDWGVGRVGRGASGCFGKNFLGLKVFSGWDVGASSAGTDEK